MPSSLYHADPYCAEVTSVVESIFDEDERWYLALKDNLFYPQGGGQKGDIGTVETALGPVAVTDTVKDQYASSPRSLLVLAGPCPGLEPGAAVTAKLDWPFRYRQMRLHSTVHLHHCLIEQVGGIRLPHPKTSDIGDGEAYNRYEGIALDEGLVERATEALRAAIAAGAAVATRDDDSNAGFRWWDCLGFSIPCGGTHLRDIAEIGAVEVSFSQKKGKPKITFRLSDGPAA